MFPTVAGLSFLDASIVAYMAHHGMKTLYSFDAGFDRVSQSQRRETVD